MEFIGAGGVQRSQRKIKSPSLLRGTKHDLFRTSRRHAYKSLLRTLQ
jgi:hypothetical protein